MRKMIHTGLIKLNGVKVVLQDELKELENMRKGINDTQRAKLEKRIAIRKVMIENLCNIELDFRSEL
jgi:hypothetical protein